MAKLKIQAPLGKTLVVDVGDADPSEYDDMAAAALEDFKSKMSEGDRTAAANLESLDNRGPVDDLISLNKGIGDMTKAGLAGTSDLIAGNGLQRASQDVKNVEEDKPADTKAGKAGSFIGSFITPAQLAMQEGLGAAVNASGLGPWTENLLKGWSQDAARTAIGVTKAIAKSIGLEDLPALSQFLMQPVRIGGNTFAPIVTATSSTEKMLAAVRAIKAAAGAQLGTVSSAVDAAIKAGTEEGGEAITKGTVTIDLAGLQKALQELKAGVSEIAPNLGKAVVNQYENAINDLNQLIGKALQGDSATVFSDLSKLKTTIGDLVYKHGSPLESKAALNDVYHAISATLDDAAKRVGGQTGAAYDVANATYHKAVAVESALEGKAISAAAKGFFNDVPALASALIASHATTGPLGLVTGPAMFAATKMAEKLGPQAVARGLDASAPFLGSALRGGIRALPVVGNAIAQGLSSDEGQ